MGIKNGANSSFSVKIKIFSKLNAQILQMRYQNIQKCSNFTVNGKKLEISQFIIMFLSVKNRLFLYLSWYRRITDNGNNDRQNSNLE